MLQLEARRECSTKASAAGVKLTGEHRRLGLWKSLSENDSADEVEITSGLV
jgi:hypothetical protein